MTDSLLTDTVGEIFAAICTDDALSAAERDGFAPRAWAAVADAGLPWISVPEAAGGEGGDLADALVVLRLAGYHGLPLPLAETGLLAGWLLAASGLQVSRVPTTVASCPNLAWSEGTARGAVPYVAWGRAAGQVVVLAPAMSAGPAAGVGGRQAADAAGIGPVIGVAQGAPHPAPDGLMVAIFAVADLRVEPHVNVAGEPRDTLYFDGAAPLASAPAGPGISAQTLRRRGALTRVALMAGAVGRIRDLTVRYTGERYQFGKPIGRFPGVQQHVVSVAQQAAMLEMAADLVSAVAVADPGLAGQAAAFQLAAAKSVAADAATIATAAAHQAHGAMGMTQEYPLHFLTRRLSAWTREYGTGAQSADELGAIIASADADALWPAIASAGTTLTPPDPLPPSPRPASPPPRPASPPRPSLRPSLRPVASPASVSIAQSTRLERGRLRNRHPGRGQVLASGLSHAEGVDERGHRGTSGPGSAA
jgi:acyl-CoA dehydrogenase